MYRRNRTGPGARWDQLDPSLHIAYIIARADTPVTPCALCNEADHTTEDCMLASSQLPTKASHAEACHQADRFLPASLSALPPTDHRPEPPPGEWLYTPRGTAGGAASQGHAISGTHALYICGDNHQARTCPRNPPTSGNQPTGQAQPTESRH